MPDIYKLFSFLAILLALQSAVYAQNTGKIVGTIKTSDGKPAGYVSVGLKNAGKAAVTDEDGAFSIKNVKPGSYVIKISAVGIASQEKPVNVVAGQTAEISFSISQSASQLDEVAINGYKTPNQKPVNLGKIAIAPRDLPQAVQIIGSQVIQDQQANRLADVLKNVNGVSLGANRGSVGENFFARGYSLGSNNVFKNGVRTTIGGIPEASTLESVEVLKGSAALLYGGVTGGAVVNMVTKKPKFEYGGEVSMRVGSYDLYKPTLDLYGPISKKLAFRVIGTYEKAGSFRDNVNSKRIYVNPSLLYKISDNTELLVQGDYLKSDFTPDFGIGTIANQISPLGRNVFVNTLWAYNKTNTATAQANLSHKINDNWKINASASLQSYNRNYFSAERPFANDQGIAARNLTRSKTKEFTYNEQINLNGNFSTGSITHTLLVGMDADQSNVTAGSFIYPQYGNTTSYNYGNINLLDPFTFNTRTDMPETVLKLNTRTPVYRIGGFVQDLITVTEQFKVLAGLRWTAQKNPATTITTVADNSVTRGLVADKTDKAFSPKVGLIYQPVKTTSFYVSYASNFMPNTGTDIYSAPLKPSTIDQYEAGIKNDFLEGKLSANVTAYRIINNNYAQQALLDQYGKPNADANIKEFSGKSASDGVEIDITGTIIEGLNFIAGYSYNYMRYTHTMDQTTIPGTDGKPTIVAGYLEGQRLVGTTKNTANGSLFYTFTSGSIKGLKLGTSVFYTGDRNGGYNDKKDGTPSRLIPLKGFTTLDFSAGYSWKKLSLLGKISNITNVLNYYVHENYSVNPIPPRQFVTTLAYKF